MANIKKTVTEAILEQLAATNARMDAMMQLISNGNNSAVNSTTLAPLPPAYQSAVDSGIMSEAEARQKIASASVSASAVANHTTTTTKAAKAYPVKEVGGHTLPTKWEYLAELNKQAFLSKTYEKPHPMIVAKVEKSRNGKWVKVSDSNGNDVGYTVYVIPCDKGNPVKNPPVDPALTRYDSSPNYITLTPREIAIVSAHANLLASYAQADAMATVS